jgi:CRISPR-associated endonuclease Cas2
MNYYLLRIWKKLLNIFPIKRMAWHRRNYAFEFKGILEFEPYKYRRRTSQWNPSAGNGHVQKSVFEGKITDSSLKRLKQELTDTVEAKQDSICIYCLESPKYTWKECIGIQEYTSNII